MKKSRPKAGQPLAEKIPTTSTDQKSGTSSFAKASKDASRGKQKTKATKLIDKSKPVKEVAAKPVNSVKESKVEKPRSVLKSEKIQKPKITKVAKVKKLPEEKSGPVKSSKKEVSLNIPTPEELLDAGVHFGHQSRRWHPSMQPFIHAKTSGIHIINLFKTHDQLKLACDYLYNVAKEGGAIIFVGTKRQAQEIVENEAKRCGAMYVSHRWLGGTLTNYDQIKKNIQKLIDLTTRKETGDFAQYTKKERLLIDREIQKLNLVLGGIVRLSAMPKAVFIVDVKKEKTAVRECVRMFIPTIALCDTNSDISKITYPIPGNDDAIKSLALLIRTVANAVDLGYKEYNANKKL